jgi:hypothetical protein
LRDWIAAQSPVQPVTVPGIGPAPTAGAATTGSAVSTASAPVLVGFLLAIPVSARIAIAAAAVAAVLTVTGIAVIPRVVAPGSSRPASIQSSPRVSTAPAEHVAAVTYVPTALILDASGSMIRGVPGGGTRKDAARSAATTLVQGFGDGATVGLTVFGTSTGNKDSDRVAGCSDVKRLIPVGKIDKAAFTTAIAGITQSGFTPLGPALNDAAAQLGDAQTGLIVLVADGVDSCAPPSACDVAAQIKAAHPGFTIQTVGFAVDADEQAQEDLACIAPAGGGEFVDAANAGQLATRLRALTDPVATVGTLTSRGLDQLEMGMSMADAKSAVNGWKLGKVLLDIQYVACDQGTLQFSNGRLVGIIPTKKLATADGVKVGDTLATAAAIYGPGTSGSDDAGVFQSFPTAPGSDSGYAMYVANPADAATKILRIILCLCGGGTTGPSEISAWKIGYGHVGPIKVGMMLSDVWKIVPNPGQAAGFGGACPYTHLSTGGAGKTVAIGHDDRGQVDVILVMGSAGIAPRMPKGVGLGSTFENVAAAYPQTIINRNTEAPEYSYAALLDGDQSMFFDAVGFASSTDFDRVRLIQISHGTQPAKEFCG